MKFEKIIDELRNLADNHVKIKGFYTGMTSQHNDSNIIYPALRVSYPFKVNAIGDNLLKFSFNISLLVDSIPENIECGINDTTNINYSTQNNILNEMDEVDLENSLREESISILTQYIAGLIEIENSIRNDEGKIEYLEIDTDYTINSLERVYNDKVTGGQVTLNLTVGNSYACESLHNLNNSVWYETQLNNTQTNLCLSTTNQNPTPPLPQRYSMNFNFTNEFCDISQSSTSVYDLDWRNPFAFESWYKPASSVYGVLWSKINVIAGYFIGTTTTRRVRFQIRTSTPGVDGVIDVFSPENSIIDDEWNHIIVSYNGGGGSDDVTFTINGVEQPKPNFWSQGNQLIGGSSLNNAYAQIMNVSAFGLIGGGKLANERLWKNVELSFSEALTLYNNGLVLYDNIPKQSDILFETGFGDENKAWYGAAIWMMQEMSGSSNAVFTRNILESGRDTDIPTI